LLYRNFINVADPKIGLTGAFTAHFWSLSVEEHFYVLLSIFLKTVRRSRLATMAILYVALRVVQHFCRLHNIGNDPGTFLRSYWVIQYLMFPAVLAVALRVPAVYVAAKSLLRPWVAFLGTGVYTFGDFLVRNSLHALQLGTFLHAEESPILYFFSSWVIASMLHPESWTTKVLELAPVRYLGRLSYSIYVWHMLALVTVFSRAQVTWAPLVFLGQRPVRYLTILVLAMMSYYLVERPMIRLGHKLAPPATPGHADLDVDPLTGIGTA